MQSRPAGQPALAQQVMDAFDAVLQGLHSARPLPAWAGLSLTLVQLTALFVLFRRGPLPTGRLGELLGLGKPAATLLVSALVQRGLVERHEDPRDRRRTLVQLAPPAQSLLAEHYAGSRQQLEAWLARLEPADLSRLARGLGALAGVVGAAAACAPADPRVPVAAGGRE